jgi:hypothetical protein
MNPAQDELAPNAQRLLWKVDECSVYFERLHLRGWCHHAAPPIVRVDLVYANGAVVLPITSYGQDSADVEKALGPTASQVRFDEWVTPPYHLLGEAFSLRFSLSDGSILMGEDALTNAARGDPYFQSWENFLAALAQFRSGAVLEVGSRARSAITRRNRIPSHLTYVGLDILPGPNVDRIGDAHELSALFPDQRFVAIFSTSVFEHLAMPWKVALEFNRVLVTGGLVYTSTHQTFPIHEAPWDFWRFSNYSWSALFNAATGFEIVETAVGEAARIHAIRGSSVTRTTATAPAYLGSASIVRKTAETTLAWAVPVSAVTHSPYPSGELTTPPTYDPT